MKKKVNPKKVRIKSNFYFLGGAVPMDEPRKRS